MILALDIGNTHIEVGLYREGQYLDSWRIATGVHRTEDELMVYIQHFLNLKELNRRSIRDLAIASVVPNITRIFEKLSHKYFKKNPLVVDNTLDLGIEVDYEPPYSVGADRLCNAVAAFTKFGGPAVIVDMGTATTFDVVTAEGIYRGGVIAPGLETAAWGLHERASKLPSIALEFPPSVIGRTTEQSMQSGVMLGTVKMIDGLIEMIGEELSAPPVVVATGGLSRLIAPKSRYIQHVENHLVLDGLIQIYLRNRSLQGQHQ
ncbi:MAG: type III pantothenate kinase [Calditrichaceae bacterium]|nr:type III pantothenate kinase [Calditrichia bacterium]NUQ43011.1 type III pantothenate kinase [Calditrichaceae bacterium]